MHFNTSGTHPGCGFEDVVIGHGRCPDEALADARSLAGGPVHVVARTEVAGHHTVLVRARG